MDPRRDTGGATTVIVADDEEGSRTLLAQALRDDGYDVLEAADGVALLTMLDDPTLNADVVVTDVKMPRLSGLGVLHALRHARGAIPVVVMTGLADPSIRTVAMTMGAVAVLKKPFDPAEMLSAVRQAGARTHRDDRR